MEELQNKCANALVCGIQDHLNWGSYLFIVKNLADQNPLLLKFTHEMEKYSLLSKRN